MISASMQCVEKFISIVLKVSAVVNIILL